MGFAAVRSRGADRDRGRSAARQLRSGGRSNGSSKAILSSYVQHGVPGRAVRLDEASAHHRAGGEPQLDLRARLRLGDDDRARPRALDRARAAAHRRRHARASEPRRETVSRPPSCDRRRADAVRIGLAERRADRGAARSGETARLTARVDHLAGLGARARAAHARPGGAAGTDADEARERDHADRAARDDLRLGVPVRPRENRACAARAARPRRDLRRPRRALRVRDALARSRHVSARARRRRRAGLRGQLVRARSDLAFVRSCDRTARRERAPAALRRSDVRAGAPARRRSAPHRAERDRDGRRAPPLAAIASARRPATARTDGRRDERADAFRSSRHITPRRCGPI